MAQGGEEPWPRGSWRDTGASVSRLGPTSVGAQIRPMQDANRQPGGPSATKMKAQKGPAKVRKRCTCTPLWPGIVIRLPAFSANRPAPMRWSGQKPPIPRGSKRSLGASVLARFTRCARTAFSWPRCAAVGPRVRRAGRRRLRSHQGIAAAKYRPQASSLAVTTHKQ
jgi:hypothetical protein